MAHTKRSSVMVAGDREAQAIAATLGGRIRSARTGLRLRLADLAPRAGISVSQLSRIEHGRGADTPVRTWIRLGIALDRPIAVGMTETASTERLVDAGHLEMQEWLLEAGRRLDWDSAGWEVPTRPLDPRRSIDVLVRIAEVLVLFECWNTIRDLGAAVRATTRKIGEANELAVAIGARTVASCWLVRPTASNRAIVRTYPEAIRVRFAASRAWAETLRARRSPPAELGFVWLDPRSGVAELRLRGDRGTVAG